MDLFRVEDFSFTYEGRSRPALSKVNFSVAPGEFAAVCGRSGGGKSTLLKMLKTSLRPAGRAEGAVYFAGRPLESVPSPEQDARIAFVRQRPEEQLGKTEGETVEEALLAGLGEQKLSQETVGLRIGETASFFGLQGWFGKQVSQLSGGQRQLLSLAAAMVLHPEVLLLDEPTSQLDPIAASEFLETVAKLNRETGVAVLLCEHRLEEVLPLADRTLVVDSGTIPVNDSPGRAASRLWTMGHPLSSAMPAPVRIYQGLCSPKKNSSIPCEETPPLTVREGRKFLENLMASDQAGSEKAERAGLDTAERIGIETAERSGVDTAERIGTETAEYVGSDATECAGSDAAKQAVPEMGRRSKTPEDRLISVKEVWFRYARDGQDAVRNLNLNIPRQKLFCLMGGNGTGKTTALRLLAGERRPYRGRIRILDEELSRKRLPQNPGELFDGGTVRELLERAWDGGFCPDGGNAKKEALRRADGGSEREEAILRVAEQMEIQEFLGFLPETLSGGEQQRTALALVFLSQAELLLLDEPTKGMDSYYKSKFGELLQKIVSSGKTVVMVSHDVEFCAEYADRCAMFFDGGVVSEGEPHEFFAGNSFYTTAANRMSRQLFPYAVTAEDMIRCARQRTACPGSRESECR